MALFAYLSRTEVVVKFEKFNGCGDCGESVGFVDCDQCFENDGCVVFKILVWWLWSMI